MDEEKDISGEGRLNEDGLWDPQQQIWQGGRKAAAGVL